MAKIQKTQAKVVKPSETKSPVKKVSATSFNAGGLFKPGGVPAMGMMNYMLMAVGFVIVLIGFALMMGGKTTDPNVFDVNEIYSFRRVTLAPIVIMLGFAVEILAIFYKVKSKDNSVSPA